MEIVCDMCQILFSTRFSLKRHKKNVHSAGKLANTKRDGGGFICLDSECNRVSFLRNSDFVKHLSNVHNIHMDVETFECDTMEDFLLWRQQIEKDLKMKYSHYGKWGKTTYYLCHRSKNVEKIVPDERKMRRRKTQGSCRLPFKCTSQLKVIQNESDGRLIVEWVKTHYGHDLDVKHLPLPALDRMAIAEKLRNGETPDNILRSVNQNVTEECQRIDFLTKADIRNIRTAYKIDAVKEGTHCVSLDRKKTEEFQERLLELQNCAPIYSADEDTHKKVIKYLKMAINLLALPAKHVLDPLLPEVSKKTPSRTIIPEKHNQKKRKVPDSHSAVMSKKGRIQQMKMQTSDKNTSYMPADVNEHNYFYEKN